MLRALAAAFVFTLLSPLLSAQYVDDPAGFEQILIDTPSPDRLRAWHDMTSSEPHVAGMPGDLRLIKNMSDAFREMGLEVEEHEIHVYLAKPVVGEIEIVAPERVDLVVKEQPVDGDPFSSNKEHDIGWNAYSGSGEVTAPVVYVNHGRKQDFEALNRAGVDLTGKIAVARYGGNFRGYKAKFAEAAGASGLIIYTDPKNDARGDVWPEGGWANEWAIQRGSIKTLDYAGDPLTPFMEASKDAARLDPSEIALPTIPVQPIGYGAAREILSRMNGRTAAEIPGMEDLADSWQGGLGFDYRVEGGDELRVRLRVEQERRIVKTYNVLGTLRGSEEPEREIVIGCHHDAWGYGAGDPNAGLICVLEAARSFSEAAKKGYRPKRSITFAGWGAEEHGIIGSTEWVEANAERLRDHCVAYLNLDMAAMGPNFRSSASPSLHRVMIEASKNVPQTGDPERSVFDQWSGGRDEPGFGDLGGGSDHVGFLCHIGVPCASLGGGGSSGVSYHQMYDNLAWYRAVVGDDYEPAVMVTRMTNLVALRLANEAVIPLDAARYGPATVRHIDALRTLAEQRGLDIAGDDMLGELRAAAIEFTDRYTRVKRGLDEHDLMDRNITRVSLNRMAFEFERAWLYEPGIPQRPWYRNLYAAPDADSGYAPWMLPALRFAVEMDDSVLLEQAEQEYLRVFERMNTALDRIKPEAK